MKKTLQILAQIVFLALFIILVVVGRIQLWIFLFLAGVVVSIFAGRLFCGWVCPINTMMRAVTWIKKKLHIGSISIPAWIKKPWLRYALLGVFIALFAFTMATGKKLPVLPVVVGLGVLITLLFPAELWHRYLCPFGTIFSIPGRFSRHTMDIDASKCTNCGLCAKACPAAAIEKGESAHTIVRKDCLVCQDCERACPSDAISYK